MTATESQLVKAARRAVSLLEGEGDGPTPDQVVEAYDVLVVALADREPAPAITGSVPTWEESE